MSHPTTSSQESSPPPVALPHYEDGIVPNVDAEIAVDSSANYLDYPEREVFIRQLSRDSVGASASRNSSSRKRRPWWKRPSIYWVLPLATLRHLCIMMGAAPQIEILTRMACQVHRPDLEIGHVQYPDWRDDPPPRLPPVTRPPQFPWSVPPAINEFNAFGLGDIISSRRNSTKPPTRGRLCAKDPEVIKAVGSVITVVSVMVGLTTTLTAAWWGQRADLWGRTTVSAISALAQIIIDLTLVMVTHFSSQLPGKSYWWIIPGGMVAGMLGGGYGSGHVSAYLSDCTEPSNKAAVFAIHSGASMAGLALAPVVGAQLVHHSGNLLSVFYLSLAVNVCAILMWIFVVPESLSPETRAANIKKMDEERIRNMPDPTHRWASVYRWFHPIVQLLLPLKAFIPRWKDASNHALGRDWNLTVLGIEYFVVALSASAITYFLPMTQALWGWDNEMVGYWLGLLGASRAVYLLLIFPVIVRVFKPKPQPVALEGPDEQLHAELSQPRPGADADAEDEPPAPVHTATPDFDLTIVRVSLVLDASMYVCLFLSATPAQWMLSSMGLAMGGSLFPSLMSLALVVYPGGDAEAGTLFGGFNVVLSLGSEVFGQILFGSLFRLTVSVFPRFIILFAAVVIGCALLVTLFIRVPKAMSPGTSA